ncbi:MAG: hypothetical protein ACRD3S_11980 [Terracidiphilus sp.]
MRRENAHRVVAATAVLGFALAALAFYGVRNYLAAFVLFSFIFLALAGALLLVISAEEALVWALRWTENVFGRYLHTRHLALATHSAHQRRSGGAR